MKVSKRRAAARPRRPAGRDSRPAAEQGRWSVTRLINFCYGHRLMNYDGKCRFLHGHNGVLEVTVGAYGLDPLGMVMDFEEIKRSVRSWVDRELDHKTILCEKDPLVGELRRHGQPIVTVRDNPTAEVIARLVFDHARGEGLPVESVRLWETPASCATYRG